jgi:ribosomal protein S25
MRISAHTGVTTDLAAHFFKLLRFMVLLMNKPAQEINLNPDVLSASFKTIDMEHIRQKLKLKPKIARKVFKSLMNKAKSVVGTNNRVQLYANC